MINSKCINFIESRIELIEDNNWKKFFHELLIQDTPPINNNEVLDIISTFKIAEIKFSEKDRKAAVLEVLRTTFINLWEDSNVNSISLGALYDIDNGNWAGYSLTEFETLCAEYAIDLGISVIINNTSDPLDTIIEIMEID